MELSSKLILESTGSSEFNQEPILGVELTPPNNRVRPPKMIALDSTKESITWMLSELDPKIRIDKYQVSCWDDVNTNTRLDVPCCKIESEPAIEGNTEALLTINRLQPNTSYICQGGMKIEVS